MWDNFGLPRGMRHHPSHSAAAFPLVSEDSALQSEDHKEEEAEEEEEDVVELGKIEKCHSARPPAPPARPQRPHLACMGAWNGGARSPAAQTASLTLISRLWRPNMSRSSFCHLLPFPRTMQGLGNSQHN